jgi:Zn finger protein HypA/HybF involved in hydrogenase expression
MHELAITQSLVDTIVERLGDARVSAVHLEIGQLSGILPYAVRFCFDLVAEGTTVERARLQISEPVGEAEQHEQGRRHHRQGHAAAERLDGAGSQHVPGKWSRVQLAGVGGTPRARVSEDSTSAASGRALVSSR